MSNSVVPAVAAPTAAARSTALARAQTSLYVGATAAVALASIILFVPTSTDDASFHHIGDYFLTAVGIPFVLAPAFLLPTLRTLQGGRDGRLGLAGVLAMWVGAVVLTAMFVYGLIAATGGSLGPTYVIASAVTIVGVLLFAIGSWRARLLPRWLLAAWPIAWAIGGLLPILGPGPLLLAAVYVAMAVLLQRHHGRLSR
jgi:hypothetical protein